jgi:hypothetical protein
LPEAAVEDMVAVAVAVRGDCFPQQFRSPHRRPIPLLSAVVVLAGQTGLERLLTVLILFLAPLHRPAAAEALTFLQQADQAQMALLAVLGAARRLMRLLAQVSVLEEQALQVKVMLAETLQVLPTFQAAEAVELQQLDQTRQEQLVVLAGLVLTLIQHGRLQHQPVFSDFMQGAVEEVLSTEEPGVLVALEGAAGALMGPLALPERLTPEAVVVPEAKRHPQEFSTALLAVLEL